MCSFLAGCSLVTHQLQNWIHYLGLICRFAGQRLPEQSPASEPLAGRDPDEGHANSANGEAMPQGICCGRQHICCCPSHNSYAGTNGPGNLNDVDRSFTQMRRDAALVRPYSATFCPRTPRFDGL